MKKSIIYSIAFALSVLPIAGAANAGSHSTTYTRANLHAGHEYLKELPYGIPARDVVYNESGCYYYVKDGRAYQLKDRYHKHICKPRGGGYDNTYTPRTSTGSDY